MTDFGGLLRRLTEAQVNFILIGGVTATVHGSPRLTLDLDIIYERSPGNFRKLTAALADVSPYPRGAPPGLPFQWNEHTLARGLNFTLTTAIGDINVLGEIAGGGSYPNLLPHTFEVQVFGHKCRCLELNELIRVKRAAGRPKDFEVIAELEAIREERGE
jgi:hypothetical protein